MLLTEEEARKKWCPHARSVMRERGVAGFNRGHDLSAGDEIPLSFCLASACMAWRWNVGPLSPPGTNLLDLGYRRATSDVAQQRGYCGLAGKAE